MRQTSFRGRKKELLFSTQRNSFSHCTTKPMFMDLPCVGHTRAHSGEWVCLCSAPPGRKCLALPPLLQECCCHPLFPLQPPPHRLGTELTYRNILATFMAGFTACYLESSLKLYFQYDEKIITFIPLNTEMFSFLKSYKEFSQTQLPFLFFLLPNADLQQKPSLSLTFKYFAVTRLLFATYLLPLQVP